MPPDTEGKEPCCGMPLGIHEELCQEVRITEIYQRCVKASPGPWEGCNHVRDHAFDTQCKCGAADVWSRPADTIVVSAYREKDDAGNWRGGPPQVSREQELHNMTFVAHARQDIEFLLHVIGKFHARTPGERGRAGR